MGSALAIPRHPTLLAYAAATRDQTLDHLRHLGLIDVLSWPEVLAVEAGGERLTVLVDGPGGKEGQDVTFYLRDYGHVDHGYAATVHKAQGMTVDRAHVLASGPGGAYSAESLAARMIEQFARRILG